MSKNTTIRKASIKQLEQELAKRKQEKISEIERERASLADKIISLGGKVDSPISATPLSRKPTTIKKSMSRVRAVNDKPLKDLLLDIASDGAARSAVDFLDILKANGWKSSSNKPYYVVAAALAAQEKKNIFRRVQKGSYQLVRREPEAQ